MGTPAAIRAGLKAALDPLVTAGTLAQVAEYPLSSPSPPCAFVEAGPIDYDKGVRTDRIEFKVVVLIPYTSDIQSQTSMDALRAGTGASSVKALIETDVTLGGACDTCRVTMASEPVLYTPAAGAASLGCVWTVDVLTLRG